MMAEHDPGRCRLAAPRAGTAWTGARRTGTASAGTAGRDAAAGTAAGTAAQRRAAPDQAVVPEARCLEPDPRRRAAAGPRRPAGELWRPCCSCSPRWPSWPWPGRYSARASWWSAPCRSPGCTWSRAEVLGAAGIRGGTPLIRINTSMVARRVERLTQVQSAHVSRAWPDTIVIVIQERTPALAVARRRLRTGRRVRRHRAPDGPQAARHAVADRAGARTWYLAARQPRGPGGRDRAAGTAAADAASRARAWARCRPTR